MAHSKLRVCVSPFCVSVSVCVSVCVMAAVEPVSPESDMP